MRARPMRNRAIPGLDLPCAGKCLGVLFRVYFTSSYVVVVCCTGDLLCIFYSLVARIEAITDMLI